MQRKLDFDYEIIKDAICESDTSVNRKNIIFENVYLDLSETRTRTSGPMKGYIMAPYRELIWSNKFSLSVEEYESRLKQKLRVNKLSDLGI